jgi:phage N-6-adenine-methyltransferase
MSEERPDVIHGRLMEKLHISGYELTRGLQDLEILLEGDKWKQLGNGFDDIDVFLESLQLKTFKYTIEQRQNIVKKLGAIRGASQRAIAQAVGVSQPTIQRDMEADTSESKPKKAGKQKQDVSDAPDTNVSKQPSVQSGEAAAKAAAKAANVHVSKNSGENEWYTPSEYIEAARRVMGSIDLDPASSEIANKTVKARKFYTIEDNGLEQVWSGNVFMNPPYSSELIKQFSSKYAILAGKGSIQSGIVLVNNATETVWFQEILAVSTAVCFVKGRIKFIDMDGNPSGAPLQGQAFLFHGDGMDRFVKEFSLFGEVLVHAKR